MEKFVYYNALFDIYGFLLTKKNAQIFSLYYAENLTMQEIADLMHVSKSFIGNSIKHSEQKLDTLEQKLHIWTDQEKIQEILNLNDLDQIKKKLNNLINNS